LFVSLVLLFGSFMLYVWFHVRQQIHMLQLNSYFNERYVNWLKDQTRKEASYLMFALIVTSFTISTILPLEVYYLLHAVLFLTLKLFLKRPAEKKPLVFTWRVKRLMLTLSILTAIMLILLCWLFKARFWLDIPFFLGIINLLLPGLVLLANIINAPWEKKIGKGYTEDAKKRLAGMPQLKVIGVTGSYGKTSTKYVLNQLLSVKYQVLMTPESYNTPMGVVRTIREQLNGTHQVFIVEMGAKNVGDIKEICDIVQPQMGIISSIGPQHLETFQTIDNIIATKFELADAVEAKNGTIILNYNNEFIRQRKLKHQPFRYGIAAEGENPKELYDLWADELTSGPGGSSFKICQPDGKSVAFTTRLLGRHNVLNITAAAAAALSLGLTLEQLVAAVKRIEPVPHRLQLLPSNGRYQIIDDAYNSNPLGALAALEALGDFPGFRVLITPGMVELGSEEVKLNQKLGEQAARYCDFMIFVGKNRAEPLLAGALKGGFSKDKTYVAKDIHDAIHMADILAGDMEQAENPMFVLLENDLPDNYIR
jgi:UDP-N-acetylmuramoyl-tripeptide--D-alanyl-D-alanine ligase